MTAKQVLRLGLIALFGGAYIWLGHQASISAHPPLLSVLIGLAPLSASALVLAWHSRSRWLLGLCVGCLVLMLVFLDFLRANTPWVYFIQHAGMHAMLAVMFGRTLRGGDDRALCSLISQLVYGSDLDAAFFRYTWNVTLVWTLYFALATLLSVGLFFFGPLELWSAFANLATPFIIGAIFVIEYLVRLRALPRRQHASIAATIRAYREYSQRNSSN